jgi:hypothetical protein
MAHGGRRPGAGRKKGNLPETKLRKDIALKALADGTTPLEVMLEAMRLAYDEGGPKAAMPFAKECAPYVHPKLANIEAKVDGVIGQYEAQPIPVEQRNTDSLEGTARPPTRGH